MLKILSSDATIPYGPTPYTLVSYTGPVGTPKYREASVEIGKWERELGFSTRIFHPLVDVDYRFDAKGMVVPPESEAETFGRVRSTPVDPNNALEILEEAEAAGGLDVIGIYGVQFFEDRRIIDVIDRLVRAGSYVITVFPNLDTQGDSIYPEILCRSDRIIKNPRPCYVCGRPALNLQRLIEGVPAEYSVDPFEIVGGSEFHPVCDVHVERPGAPWEDFLRPIRQRAISEKIRPGKLIVHSGTMRTGKTRRTIRDAERRAPPERVLYFKPTGDTRDEGNFDSRTISDRAMEKFLWIKRKASYFNNADPWKFYERDDVMKSRAFMVDECQILSMDFPVMFTALRMGGTNGIPKDIVCAGIPLSYRGEVVVIPPNHPGEVPKGSMPFLLSDATRVDVGSIKCQMDDDRCRNRGNRQLLINGGEIVTDFTKRFEADDLVGDDKYRISCMAHYPEFSGKPEFLDRPVLKRFFTVKGE